MENKKIIYIIIPILCAIVLIISYLNIINNKGNNKFKNEYEELNGKKTESNKIYKTLNISSNNPIIYSNYDEIIDIIKNKTGVIYLGFPECPWCRNAVPVLFDVAKKHNINKIYYLNIKNERDSYYVENGKLTYSLDDNGNEIKGSNGYFKLLDALKDNLSDYTIMFEGKTYKVNEKRIYAPSVIFVKDGKVLGIHVATVESQTDPYKDLTNKQKNELYGIYEDYIIKLENSTCAIGSSC